ncbi:HNH endonuclease signature motif containing protein [Allokutzneria multivorans]|uniref:HNH endonuclease signature motif containing protein n=1 Tax=Allokutzneria multivorans TaxID=1142134 RepID=A0ABP7T777_9PSEU
MSAKAIIALLKRYLARGDTYRFTGDPLLDELRNFEKIATLAVAASTDLATEAQSQGLYADQGCKDLTVLLRTALKLAPEDAKRRSRLVQELPSLPLAKEAMYAGTISPRHALVVSDAVAKIPEDRAVEAEEALVDHAPQLNPRQLMYVGKRIRTQLDPEGAYRDEQENIAQRSVKMGKDHNGWLHFTGILPPVEGAAVEAALHALASPRSGEDTRTPEQRYADSFTEAMKIALATRELPTNGGQKPQIIITIPYHALLTAIGFGDTSWGGPLSAHLIREMACDANIVPAVLNGKNVPLNLGRSKRTASPGMRTALAVRDKGCAFPGCDRPPAWTEAHHVVHWLDGGPTDLDNMVLLCTHHHHVMHQQGWEIVFEQGLPTFIPPRWVDPDQKPTRNIRVELDLALTP